MDAATQGEDVPQRAEAHPPPQTGYTVPVPLLGPAGEPGCRVVAHLDVRVLGTRGHKLAIRVEIQAADVGFVSHECAKD